MGTLNIDDGKEALPAVSTPQYEEFDRVPADVQMPGMGGQEANAVRKAVEPLGCHVPISAATFDKDAALARLDGDVNLLAEMASLFLEEKNKLLEDLHLAVELQEAKALERAAHVLKGTLANLSALAAWEIADKLETKARCGDLRQIEKSYVFLTEEISRLSSSLTEFREAAR